MQRLFQNLESEDEYIGAYRGNTCGLPGLQLQHLHEVLQEQTFTEKSQKL